MYTWDFFGSLHVFTIVRESTGFAFRAMRFGEEEFARDVLLISRFLGWTSIGTRISEVTILQQIEVE